MQNFIQFLNEVTFYKKGASFFRPPIEASAYCKVGYHLEKPGGAKFVKQVHGAHILSSEEADGNYPADGVYHFGAPPCEQPLTIGVQTADCLPILISAAGVGIMALHGGWRGLASGILQVGLDKFALEGVSAGQLLLELGPCISQHRFEVGPEVVDELYAAGGHEQARLLSLNKGVADRWHVDLQLVALGVLAQAGIEPRNISVLRECTFDGVATWPSYRRQGKEAGRLWSSLTIA